MAGVRSAKIKKKAKTTMLPQEQTFARMRPRLLRRYAGKFVALYRGHVVGHGDDDEQLAQRMYEKLDDVSFYIAKVQNEAAVYEIPSPEIAR